MTETTKPLRVKSDDGLILAGEVGGPEGAPTVVMLHGGGQTRHSWSGTMEQLIARGYHVVNYDARGHGDSGWSPKAAYHVTDLANDLRAVLRGVGRPVALVGASMGGMTAFYAVGSSPEPIADALVMVDITLRPAAEGAQRIAAFMNAHLDGFGSVEEAADAVSAYYPERPRPKDISGLRKNLREGPDGRLYWHWDPKMLRPTARPEPPRFAEALRSVAGKVTLPVLLVRGGKSDIVDEEGVAEMQRLVPQTEVYDVAGAGHMIAGDRNDSFSAGLIAFLDRIMPVETR
ncbi:alpha/beta fold hydrolase [Rhizorhabdus sp. FW153]|uniref:alpha/beta fold hydrolase n=1 Tax=Rhizorhabdus sp. FW153 TaxID=3400216 RepID=UPI003CF0FF4A